MSHLEEIVEKTVKAIDALHESLNRTDWSTLKKDGFVFELERATGKLKEIYSSMRDISKESTMMLEKNTPDISDTIEIIRKELILLESNIRLEKHKQFRVELVNENEPIEVPELYSSLQNKILECALKARYSAEKIKTFLTARRTPFVQKGSTAKNLIGLVQKKEDELVELRKRNLELKRKSFLGNIEEKSLAEIEEEMFAKDKALSAAVTETNKSLKQHLAQINYVEGSFANLNEKVRLVEELHANYGKKAMELIRELKKERDHARKMALELEEETMRARNEYTNYLLEKENRISEVKEKTSKKYVEEIMSLKRDLSEKRLSIANIIKLVEELEKENKSLKERLKDKIVNEAKD